MKVNGQEFNVIKLLGKGKGGYSYLVTNGKENYVLKQIHHEPCSYYQFGNKIEAEINDYNTLKNIGLRMPRLIEADIENERILKEYIEGNSIRICAEWQNEARLPRTNKGNVRLTVSRQNQYRLFPDKFHSSKRRAILY